MRFDFTDFAAFDIFILQRKGAEQDFPEEVVAAAKTRISAMNEAAQQALAQNIVCGLPGAAEHFTLEGRA